MTEEQQAHEEPQPNESQNQNLNWLVGHGVTGLIKAAGDGLVEKDGHANMCAQIEQENFRDIEIERCIYERLGPHPRIYKFIRHEEGINTLKRYKQALGHRLIDIAKLGGVPNTGLLLRWARQVAEAFAYIHSKGVLQSDISWGDCLLDEEDNLVLCDFAGSSIDGSESAICSGPRYRPGPWDRDRWSDLRLEVFAIGTLLYNISTATQPYPDVRIEDDELIERGFDKGVFPDTRRLILGSIIRRCWVMSYNCADEILRAIELTAQEHEQKGMLRLEGKLSLSLALVPVTTAVLAVTLSTFRKTRI